MNETDMSTWDGWEDVTPPQPDPPDFEQARRLAYDAMMDWGHHELAIDDPFAAERKYQNLGREIIKAIGFPKDIRMWSQTT